MPAIAILSSALELAACAVDGLAAGEAWHVALSAGAGGSQSAPTLCAFFSPRPLLVTMRDALNAPLPPREVDLALAREHAASHQLSMRLATSVVRDGLSLRTLDLSDDDLLRRLTFPLGSAVAIPISSRSAGRASVFSLILYLSRTTAVSSWVGRGAGRGHLGRSCSQGQLMT